MSDSHRNIWTSCNSKLKLPNLRFVYQNHRNATKIWMNVCQHKNCKTLNFPGKISVQIMTFCFPFWIHLLLTLKSIASMLTTRSMMPGPWKTSIIIAVSLALWDCGTCVLRHLTEAYQNQVNSVLCIFGSDQQDLKLHVRVGLVSSGKAQQAFKVRPVKLKAGTPGLH